MNENIICAGLIENNDKYLMVQESKDNISGLWNLPAGRLNENEKLQECAKREVFEEANIKSEPIGIIGVYFYGVEKDDVKSIIVYDMSYVSGSPEPNHHDVQDAKWLSKKEIENKELRTQYILEAIDDYKNRDRMPCSYVERVDNINPSKLAKIKMKYKNKRDDYTSRDLVKFSAIILFLAFVIEKFYNRLKSNNE